MPLDGFAGLIFREIIGKDKFNIILHPRYIEVLIWYHVAI